MLDLPSLMTLAFQAHRDACWDEAMERYRQVLALDPSQAVVHNNLGAVHAVLGQAMSAEVCYRAAIARAPDYADAHINLGHLLRQADPVRALACYESALALAPDDADLHCHYGAALRAMGRLGELLQAWRRACTLAGADADWAARTVERPPAPRLGDIGP